MVALSLFENSIKDQTLRTMLALVIIFFGDISYILLTTHSLDKFLNNKMAHINVWFTLALTFGVSLIYKNEVERTNPEINNDTIKNYTYYGILIGLLVYIPLYNWMLSCGNITNVMSICNTAFGILLAATTCLCTFLISVQCDLF